MLSEQAFMALLRSGLHDTEPPPELFAGLTPGQWSDIYAMTRRQTVTGICYAALCRLPDSLLPPDDLLTQWVARVNAIEKTNLLMASAARRLIDFLQSRGLHPLVQKGLSVARHYPAPALREAGDIDLWFDEPEIKLAVEAARELSSDVTLHSDRSYSFVYEGFVVEIHRKLINLGNPSAVRALRRLIAGEPRLTASTSAGELPVVSPLLEMLLIDVHIMRHSFGTGIGMRQICDYAVCARALRGRYSADAFADACRAFGIRHWTALLNELVATHLGVPREALPDSGYGAGRYADPSRLLDIIREGGNFGHYLPARRSILGPRARSKFHTFSLMLRRSRFAAATSPREALWSFLRLLLGQVH